MARLHIYVDVKDDKTVSKFGVTKTKRVVFHNQHATDTLVVTIDGATADRSPLCKGQQKIVSFDVTAVEKEEGYKICKDYPLDTFKYTATLGTAAAEDPIVIIETSWFFGGDALVAAVIGAGVGAIVTAVVLKFRRDRPQVNA